MILRSLLMLAVIAAVTPARAQANECPVLEKDEVRLGKGGPITVWKYRVNNGATALIIGRGMSVNADGAKAAYAVYGQHGLSYLCDGVTVSDDGVNFHYNRPDLCEAAVKEIDQLKVEDGRINFPATMKYQLCIFGFSASGDNRCHGGGATLAGAGKPASARVRTDVSDARGAVMPHFYSTTTERHSNGEALDAAVLPFVVKPRGMTSMRSGDFAYVVSDVNGTLEGKKLPQRKIPVVVGDLGPADKFGEGSIALHQYLAYGAVKPGPGFDPEVCKGKEPKACSVSAPYILPATFPYPYQDMKGGDVRAKRNWSSTLMYVLFPEQKAEKPAEYTFAMSAEGKSEGSIADGAAKAAAAFGGIEVIVDCVRRQKKMIDLRDRPS